MNELQSQPQPQPFVPTLVEDLDTFTNSYFPELGAILITELDTDVVYDYEYDEPQLDILYGLY